MPEWINGHRIHMTARALAGIYVTAVICWTLYKCYNERGRRRRNTSRSSDLNFKQVDGDTAADDESATSAKATDLLKQKRSSINLSDEDSQSDSDVESEDVLSDDSVESPDGLQDPLDIEDMGSGNTASPREQGVGPLVKTVIRKNRRRKFTSPVDYSLFKEEQITDRLREDLSKQGYKLIESHSAVKICRWTKNSMRGRGGCYKHTFYGIKSYQCMEMTPNLACASKCTFCWRHHKNPVGTEWKWKMDQPDLIVEQGIKKHLEMVRQLKGVPGVTEDRFSEAQTVRHCALSLVGEPIFYPRINELLEILHARRISTFLVTNAQFPEAMRHLVPVTQLYVSIDAPNRDALKKIDRPLYKDFWERYIECLEILAEKKQRTVFRLTLVQKANMEDLEGYARLIKIGQPNFIEIKGVTYCGTSKANKLTMENVPWHEQVVEFAQSLLKCLEDGNSYELACEHSHSNCVLIANKKFKVNGRWRTWIDYEKFFQLIHAQTTNGPTFDDFDSLDYATETPSWAIFGSDEGGFDPEHIRWVRKDHKLKLLQERMSAQRTTANCSSEADCCKDNLAPKDGLAI